MLQKEKGNQHFANKAYALAIEAYNDALVNIDSNNDDGVDLKATVLCNRAACYLKLERYDDVVADCNAVLNLIPNPNMKSIVKSLYRSSQAKECLRDYAGAYEQLNRLLLMDPSNNEAKQLYASLKAKMAREQGGTTEIDKLLKYITDNPTDCNVAIKGLIGVVNDDSFHASEFGRKGLSCLDKLLVDKVNSKDAQEGAALELQLLSALCNHSPFVIHWIDADTDISDGGGDSRETITSVLKGGTVSFVSLCNLMFSRPASIKQCLTLVIKILKSFPVSKADSNMGEVEPYLNHTCIRKVYQGLNIAVTDANMETVSLAIDIFSAFVSEVPDYISPAKIIDTRLEHLEERKERFKIERMLKERSKKHAMASKEEGFFVHLLALLKHTNPLVRQRSGLGLGKLSHSLDNDDEMKGWLQPYVCAGNDNDELPSLEYMKVRAAIEAALLMTRVELGLWALNQAQGVTQLLFLATRGDIDCQESASEVMCLAAGTEEGSALLAPVVSSGVLQSLLRSPSQAVQASAASTLTKLSIKAKALFNDSPEIAQILNAVLVSIKSSSNQDSKNVDNQGGSSLVSFSSLDNIGNKTESGKHNNTDKLLQLGLANTKGGSEYTTLERAIEVVAAIVGKSFIKEEIVHGSSRVVSIAPTLLTIESRIDMRSTAAFGLAYILAALTVTNKELRDKALQEKELTNETYEQLMKMQNLHNKDNNEEKADLDKDVDTLDLCRRRIQKLANHKVIPVLVNLLNNGSAKTKETAARAFRQICVEESSRGFMVQQGGLKACCEAANDEFNTKSIRLEAGHAVAKTLVTTNPTILSEHVRLGAIRPLLYIAKDVDSSNLMQFESLLALTNILSCGLSEQEKFVNEKGISHVHYLMFSDHVMVRRAATEAFCNMSANEDFLTLLRVPDKVRLWLALCEDYGVDCDESNDDNYVDEAYKTCRASAGTLACSCGDDKVALAVMQENIGSTIAKLLDSGRLELIHRALVIIVELIGSGGKELAVHMASCNVIESINSAVSSIMNIADSNNHMVQQQVMTIHKIAKDAAQALIQCL